MTSPLVEVLEGQGALIDFSPDELERFVAACNHRVFAAGEALWTIDQKRQSAFFLVDGVIERRIQTSLNQEVDQFGLPGVPLSLSALISDWEYHSGAYTLIRSEVLELTRDAFEALLEAKDPVAYRLIDLIATYLVDDMRRANARLQEVFGRPAETLRTLRRRIREDAKA
ncbi:MAG: Crp/Fnr family transcriptional regulator [bacterium]